ncbi:MULTISPECIES: cell division protein DedD [Symbiopectobacterium]|uniref:cell division protein DedD n=1 Tax=Symbiopectobacterium TaxID=801 RepID=UPI001A341F38|nr:MULTISPECIES: cell division protein DedD [Symbiopectobacterium]MBG6247375.1 cell division protein DedD [Candidatus Symbiopectobacterium sp. PLON1]MBT9429545.1 cell division protein DedD [Candidatus Symbiopectobacterium endolongispinus]
MASKFQNRLVGTIILVALGVIVLPALLDGKKKHYEDEFAAIPLVPKPGDSTEAESLLSLNQSLPSQPPEGAQQAMQGQPAQGGVTAPEDDDTMQVPPSSTPPSSSAPIEIAPPAVAARPVTTKVDVKLEAAPAGQAYVVQLGALKNADKVNEIVAKMRLSGYRAYTVPSTPVAGEITRIYVGPDASKQKLQSALGELQQLSGLTGHVRNYSAR